MKNTRVTPNGDPWSDAQTDHTKKNRRQDHPRHGVDRLIYGSSIAEAVGDSASHSPIAMPAPCR